MSARDSEISELAGDLIMTDSGWIGIVTRGYPDCHWCGGHLWRHAERCMCFPQGVVSRIDGLMYTPRVIAR